ncbi:tetraspanin-32 isoform X1 [Diceros bicornis minor]|uniref:tetraspanin-32 isoform X1 n=1 Tax=Diceros bicornis minor TaxID=77932 RepID=UPI0026E94B0F|nr:tetraspanin-32 isoform X1 [Diceros bicornis minor]
MGPWSRVSVAKCQMLVTSLFVLLLGLAVATMAALTYFGAHFVVIGRTSSERTSYEARHRWAFYVGISLAGLLTLGAVLTAVATVREAGGLMAGVEDAVLDTYDLVYDHAVKSSSGVWRQELVAIQDMFLCCGKGSPFSLLGSSEADLCRGAEAARQDCLQGIGRFLSTHRNIIFTLTSVGLASMVYAMLLSSFLWFAIRSGRSLDHKGRYTLNPRAHGCQSQGPGFIRCSRWGPALQHPPEADALDGHLGPHGPSDSPRLLQDN